MHVRRDLPPATIASSPSSPPRELARRPPASTPWPWSCCGTATPASTPSVSSASSPPTRPSRRSASASSGRGPACSRRRSSRTCGGWPTRSSRAAPRAEARPATSRPSSPSADAAGLPPLPDAPSHAFVVELLHAHARVRPARRELRERARRAPRAPGPHRRGRDPRRAAGGGGDPGLDRATPITSLRLCATHDWSRYVERSAWSSRSSSAIPRASTAAWTSRAATATARPSRSWRSPPGEAQVAGGAARDRAARAQRTSNGPSDRVGPRRLPPDRRGGGAARKLDVATGRAPLSACGAPSFATPPRPTWAPRCSSRCAGGRRRRGGGPGAKGPAAAPGRGSRSWPCSRRASSPSGLVQRLVAALARPRRLPRLDLEGGVPEHAAHDGRDPHPARERRGRAATSGAPRGAGARQPGPARPLRRARGLPRRADARTMPEDDAILEAALRRIEALDAATATARRTASTSSTARGAGTRAKAAGWAGSASAARSRSSFACCAATPDTSFTSRRGDLRVLPQVRYLITLDRDTRLPRDAARDPRRHRRAPPESRPLRSRRERRVTEGYGILQPRVSVTFESAAGSLFARLYAGHTGVDPYTTAVSDTYQDLFGEGIFTGKGLYRRGRVHRGPRAAGSPRTRCSPTICSRASTPAPRSSTDVEVVDDYPASVLAHARRLHRWVRGDWQILLLALPLGADAARARAQPPAPHQPLQDLRQPAPEPARAGLRSRASPAALTLLPGLPPGRGRWPLAVILAFPALLTVADVARGRGEEPALVFLRGWLERLRTDLAQALVRVTFLAYHAAEMVHAILLTLGRLVFTQRRLLEWETAASVASRAAGLLGFQGLRHVPRRDVGEPDRGRSPSASPCSACGRTTCPWPPLSSCCGWARHFSPTS